MYWYYFVIVFVLMIFSAFFSAADMVYAIVDQDRLTNAIEKGNKKAKVALNIAKDYEFTISSVLFSNTLVNIAASSVITVIGIVVLENKTLATTLTSVIFTVLLIIFAEFLPKAFAKRFNYSLALGFAYPVLVIKYVTAPIVWPISKLFSLFTKLFSKQSKKEDEITEDILDEMVDSIEEQGIVDEDEAEILRGAIDLSDIQAYEIMTPRVDVFAIDVNDDIEELIKNKDMFVYSRIPVYEDTIDNIIGVLPLKLLAREILKNNKNIDIKSLCYKPLTIPSNHQVLDLLDEFKKSKIHMAVVIDEYGGTDGIVTLEDVLEEVVGEIFDEQDEIEEVYVEKGDGKFIVSGSMNLDDFFELIEYNGEFETDYSTVSGFCLEILDHFAKENDEFDFDRFHCRVLEADEFTVEKLEVVEIKQDEE